MNQRDPEGKWADMRRYWPRNRRRLGGKARFFLFVVILVLLFFALDSQLRPVLQSAAQSQATILSTKAINDAVTEELAKQGIGYEDLVHVTQTSEGKVTSIESDVVHINQMKSQITSAIQDRFSASDIQDAGIPLGNLFNNSFMAGRGPRIPLKITLTGTVIADLQSNFSSAGINQTKHELTLSVRAIVYIMMPGYYTTAEITTNFLVAETVIVGEVPDSFTNVVTPSTDLPNIIMDYGADAK